MSKKRTLLESFHFPSELGGQSMASAYVALAKKDEKGNYSYLTPKHLHATGAKQFEEGIDKMFAIYSAVQRELTGYLRKQNPKANGASMPEWKKATAEQAALIASGLIPIAATIASANNEAQSLKIGDSLLDKAAKLIPQTLSPTAGQAEMYTWMPRNELELLEPMLFELSSQPASEIETCLDDMKYEDKISLFREYVSQGHTSALRHARYEWEVVETLGTLKELTSNTMDARTVIQELTPRHGYDIPVEIEDAGLTQHYEKGFDASYEVFSNMQSAGFDDAAELCTLLGHRARFRITLLGSDVAGMIRAAPNTTSSLKSLVDTILSKTSEIHPSLIEILNQS